MKNKIDTIFYLLIILGGVFISSCQEKKQIKTKEGTLPFLNEHTDSLISTYKKTKPLPQLFSEIKRMEANEDYVNLSIFYLHRSLNLAESYCQKIGTKKSEQNLADFYFARALISQSKGDYEATFNYVDSAQSIIDKNKLGLLYASKGRIFNELKNYKQAIPYFEKARKYLSQADSIRNEIDFSRAYQQGKLSRQRTKEFIIELSQVNTHKFIDSINYLHVQAMMINYLGEGYLNDSLKTNDTLARKCFIKAAIIDKMLGITDSWALINLTDMLNREENQNTKYFAKQCIQNDTALNSISMRVQISKLLAEVYDEKKSTDTAFNYLKKAFQYQDTLNTLSNTQTNFVTELEKKQKQQLTFFIAAISSLVFIFILVVLLIRNKRITKERDLQSRQLALKEQLRAYEEQVEIKEAEERNLKERIQEHETKNSNNKDEIQTLKEELTTKTNEINELKQKLTQIKLSEIKNKLKTGKVTEETIAQVNSFCNTHHYALKKELETLPQINGNDEKIYTCLYIRIGMDYREILTVLDNPGLSKATLRVRIYRLYNSFTGKKWDSLVRFKEELEEKEKNITSNKTSSKDKNYKSK